MSDGSVLGIPRCAVVARASGGDAPPRPARTQMHGNALCPEPRERVGTMAGTATLNRSEWKNAFDQLTADCQGRHVTIELLDPVAGHQHEVERLPFSYISYDPKDDVVIVAVGGNSPQYPVVLRHMVWHPAAVDIAVEEVSGSAARIAEPDGTTTLVTFFSDRTEP